MCISVRAHDVLVSTIDDRLPRGNVPEQRQHIVEIGEVRRERDVVLARAENIVEAPGEHDLQGLAAHRVEMPRGDAFAVDGRPWSASEEAAVNLGEIEPFRAERLMAQHAAAQIAAERRLHPIRQAARQMLQR